MSPHQIQEFESLARNHMDSLYTRAIQLATNMPQAENLVQDTYLRAYQIFSSFQQGHDFNTWLLGLLNDTFSSGLKSKYVA